jgi:hypothetical protein
MGLIQICRRLRLICVLDTVLTPMPTIRMTTSLAGAVYIRELHDITARPAFSPPTMPGLGVTKIIRRHVDRFKIDVATLVSMINGGPSSGQTVAVVKSFIWAGSPLFAVRMASNSTVDRPPHGVHPNHPLSDRAVVDPSALLPQSGNLFAHCASEVRSQLSRSRFIEACRGLSHVR